MGDIGVALLRDRWGWDGNVPPDGERRWDWVRTDGATVEVKTDTHPWDATPNFYMERYTNVRGGPRLDGGPWRAALAGVGWFVYVFPYPTPRAWAYADPGILVASIGHLHRAEPFPIRRAGSGRLRATGLVVGRDMVSAEYVLRGGRLTLLG